MAKNSELGTVEIQYVSGYASLANFIASDKDRSTVIFRRFDRLSARNLLYLQSELAELEAKQETFDREDVKGKMSDKQCARNWNDFKKTSESDESQQERMKLVRDIRTTMKEYSE